MRRYRINATALRCTMSLALPIVAHSHTIGQSVLRQHARPLAGNGGMIERSRLENMTPDYASILKTLRLRAGPASSLSAEAEADRMQRVLAMARAKHVLGPETA